VLDGRPVRIAHVEAALPLGNTVDPERAGELLDEALQQAHGRGHALAILISPAGGPGFARHGFRALPCSETACRTFLPAPWPKEPAWLRAGESALGRVAGLRPGRPEDIPDLTGIHAEEIAGQRLRIDRDCGAWEQIFLARGIPGRTGVARDPFWVIEKGGRVEAYVLLQALPPTLHWREHGARRGAESLLADLFWGVLGWARQDRLPRDSSRRSSSQQRTQLRMLLPSQACRAQILQRHPRLTWPLARRRMAMSISMVSPICQTQRPKFDGSQHDAEDLSRKSSCFIRHLD